MVIKGDTRSLDYEYYAYWGFVGIKSMYYIGLTVGLNGHYIPLFLTNHQKDGVI